MAATDWSGIAFFGLLMLVLFRSHTKNRLLWSDETVSYTVFHSGTLGGVLRSWWEGADSGGLLYYLLGSMWMRVLGLTPLTLRLLSGVCMVAAVAVLWRSARHYYRTLAIATAAGAVVFLPKVTSWQIYNGRFYGLFFLAAALAAAVFLRVAREGEERRGDRLWFALSQGALVGTHILGFVYCMGLMVGLVGLDWRRRRFRPGLYVSGMAGWVVLLVSVHAIRAITGIAKGVFWTRRPGVLDLVMGWFAYNRALLGSAVVLGLVVCLLALVQRRSRVLWRFRPEVAVLIGSLVLGQMLVFVRSQFGVSVYADRYLIPLAIGTFFLFAELLTAVWSMTRIRLSRTGEGVVVVAVLAALWWRAYSTDPYAQLYPQADYARTTSSQLGAGNPVVVTYLPVFTLLRLFDPAHHYIFATDWQYDLRTAPLGADFSGQRLMENWVRAGLAPDEVLDLPVILTRYPRFTLLADPERATWRGARLSAAQGLVTRREGALNSWYPMEVWSVARTQP